MTLSRTTLLLAAVAAGPVSAADLAKLDRTLKKEPAYHTKAPHYALLVFGPEAKDRIWLVHDGDTLYVDRNGNGDLTEPGEKVAAKQEKDRDPDSLRYTFQAGDLAVGGRLHKGLTVETIPIGQYSDAVKSQPNAKAALAADAKALAYYVALDVERPGFKGMGIGNRVVTIVGPRSPTRALIFSATPGTAPVIHIDGPLHVSCEDQRPTLKLGRDNDFALIVGTPGHGPGTFAMVCYDETIPAKAIPKLECVWAAARKGDPPVRQVLELKERC